MSKKIPNHLLFTIVNKSINLPNGAVGNEVIISDQGNKARLEKAQYEANKGSKSICWPVENTGVTNLTIISCDTLDTSVYDENNFIFKIPNYLIVDSMVKGHIQDKTLTNKWYWINNNGLIIVPEYSKLFAEAKEKQEEKKLKIKEIVPGFVYRSPTKTLYFEEVYEGPEFMWDVKISTHTAYNYLNSYIYNIKLSKRGEVFITKNIIIDTTKKIKYEKWFNLDSYNHNIHYENNWEVYENNREMKNIYSSGKKTCYTSKELINNSNLTNVQSAKNNVVNLSNLEQTINTNNNAINKALLPYMVYIHGAEKIAELLTFLGYNVTVL